jgi:hypothetical protein
MPDVDPSAVNYIHWLSTEVSSLLKIFASVNKNFIFAVVECALVMAEESVDLNALQDVAAESRAKFLLAKRYVRRAACAVSKKWLRSFSYDYVLATIHTKLH